MAAATKNLTAADDESVEFRHHVIYATPLPPKCEAQLDSGQACRNEPGYPSPPPEGRAAATAPPLPALVRCQEHADVVNDYTLCTKCGLKTDPCDPLNNYVRWSGRYQMHRNCNHPGPRTSDLPGKVCTVGECSRMRSDTEGGMCLWHYVRSPDGRVETEDKEEAPGAAIFSVPSHAVNALRESVDRE